MHFFSYGVEQDFEFFVVLFSRPAPVQDSGPSEAERAMQVIHMMVYIYTIYVSVE